ncbi:Uncharacterised protein [Mycobacteroides abscessus subsp. abscessus]|nr:Uncharacterised protein [Mycobacteroides abscessus subsp. abscessus]
MDFCEFDAIATDLDLLVGAAQVLQLSVGTPPHQITGAIHPLPRQLRIGEWARHETGSGQTGTARVSDPHTMAGDVQLTHHTRRYRT